MARPHPESEQLNALAIEAVASRRGGDTGVSESEQSLGQTEAGRKALLSAELLKEAVTQDALDTPPADVLRRAQSIARKGPLDRFVKELERFTEGAKRIAATLDFDSRFSRPQHAYRGATEATQLTFSSEACEVDLELDASGDRWRLLGQLNCEPGARWNVEVISAADERLECVARLEADESAPFRAEVPAGVFFMLLRRGDSVIELGPIIVP